MRRPPHCNHRPRLPPLDISEPPPSSPVTQEIFLAFGADPGQGSGINTSLLGVFYHPSDTDSSHPSDLVTDPNESSQTSPVRMLDSETPPPTTLDNLEALRGLHGYELHEALAQISHEPLRSQVMSLRGRDAVVVADPIHEPDRFFETHGAPRGIASSTARPMFCFRGATFEVQVT